MRGIHFLGNGIVFIDEVSVPNPHEDWVVVKICAAGICGTDRHNLSGDGQSTIPGHENAGQVVAVDKPSRVKVGDRVAINCHITCGTCEHCLNGDLFFCDQLTVPGEDLDGGFADYLLVPESNCILLPDEISYEQGALIVDVFGTAYRAVMRAQLKPGDQVAVWGGGPIGLETALVAQSLGARVAVIERNTYRKNMAEEQVGPELVLDPGDSTITDAILGWTHGEGIHVGFECAGVEPSALQAIGLIKKRGTLAIIGVNRKLTLDPWRLIEKELTIFASRNFNTSQLDGMMTLIRTGLRPEKVVTHRYSLANAEAAFDTFIEGNCGKIVFAPEAAKGA